MNSKEKFLKAIEDNWHDGDTAFKDVAKQCTRINIEEKIELLNELERNTKGISCVPMSEIENKISELTNELKQL